MLTDGQEVMWIEPSIIRGFRNIVQIIGNRIWVGDGNNKDEAQPEHLFGCQNMGDNGHCPHLAECTLPAVYFVPDRGDRGEWFCGESHLITHS